MARVRTRQVVEQQQTFVQSDTGVVFRDGVMYVNGAAQTPEQVQHWESSNGLTRYTTVAWRDPVTGQRRTSCNCQGWAVKRGDKRHCCHTKDMEGLATCSKTRVEASAIRLTTPEQMVAQVPTITLGARELRAIILSDD